jgi:hypothetical protein
VALASLSRDLPGSNFAVAYRSLSISSSIGVSPSFSTYVFYSSAVVVSAYCSGLDDYLEEPGLD